MQASLEIPTATSVRAVPAKLIADNRIIINNHLRRARGGKVSFTHLIGYAVVRALHDFPEMNNSFALTAEGKPALIQPEHVNFGLAIDLPGKDGGRSLVVAAHQGRRDDGLRRLLGRLRGHHPAGPGRQARPPTTSPASTISLTNPGTIGTNHSVPAPDAGPGHDHRRRRDGVPGRSTAA